MDNALSLLKTAIADNDIQDRTERVIKACKLITDFLPFAGEGKAIILEPELVKYLMLSVPFNARSIEWLIFSMFDKFKYNKQFLKQLWIGFSAIAFLSDKDGNDPKKENTGLRKFQTEMRKVLSLSKSSVSDDGVFESQIFKNQDFCDIIKENKEVIKLSCLKQIKRFLGVYYKELVSALNFKPDFAELLKKFLLHTSNGKIIIKTVKVIEKLRQEDPFSCDIEIEDILISKQNCIFDTPPPLQQITETAQQKPWGRANTIKPNQRTKSVLTRMNTLHDSNILNSINSRPILKKAASLLIDEAELKPKESKEASAVLKENDELRKLEEWLSGDEIGQPALMNNRADLKTYIYNFENFEYLLSFIFDPEAQPLALCWEENYSSILNAISEEDDKASDISQYSTPPKLNKADDDLKYSKLYVLRSFKTAQALGDERNFNQIFDQNKEALESYFYNIYNTLSIRKDTSCNHHHIGLLTESLVRRESDLCVGFILYYNLLYNFIQKIEVPHFQKLLLTLFKASENAKDMQLEAYAKLLRYCQSSSFFSDISLAILRGWNSFQASKFNVDYKPPGVEDLVSLAMERSEPRMLTDKSIVQSTVDLKDSFLTQELLNFQVDIDNLQAVLEKDTQIDREALLQTTQMSTPKKLKQKKYSNYPSLAELESERGTLLGSIDLSETRRGSIDNGDHNLLNTQSGKSLANMHLSHRKNAHSKVSVESQKLKGTLTPSINNSSSKKENRNVTLDPGFKDTKSGIAKKLDFDSTKPSAVKQPEGILKKVGKYTVSSLDAIPDELQTKEKPVKSLNYLGVIRRKPGTKKGFIRPIKNTVSMDLDKEAIDHEKIAELDKLYPTSARAKTSIELEASGEEYNVSNLLENDHFSLALCEFLEVLFRNALLSKPFDVDEMEKRLESGLGTYLFNQQNLNQMKQKYENKRNIGVSELDFFAFWQAVFSSNCALFENLLKNYLFKIKLHHIQENNSGYAAGVLVNLILEECVKGNPYFEPYLEQIRSICKKHMPMLCKTIVQSHAWKQRDGDKVYLQDFQVKHPLGAGRIQLVQTLKLFIENDFEQKYQICNRITDTCWHVLMIWLANNKTNNMYHQIFYTIFEITFLHSEESLLTDILVKLGFIANMYKVWSDIFQNNMLRKDNHIESILYHLRKLVYLIEFVAQRNEDYKILKRELKRSLSWEIVKSGLLPDKENPKSESRPGSENRQTFSNSFNSRMRKNGRVLDELTASKIENKSRQRLDSETSFEFPEGSANREGRISSIEKFVY